MTVDKPDQQAGPDSQAETTGEAGPATDMETPVAANDAGPDAAAADSERSSNELASHAEAEIEVLKDRVLRAVAEAENTRRRAQRDVEDARKYAVAEMARDLLGVADNLRRALDAVPAEARESHAELANLMTGVELTERELAKAFDKVGIAKIDPMGEKLDPNLHQAMMQVPDATAEPGTVVQVVQVGYKIQDRLLRPAMVGVAAPPSAGSGGPGEQVDRQA